MSVRRVLAGQMAQPRILIIARVKTLVEAGLHDVSPGSRARMKRQWLAVDGEMDPRARALELQRSWEHLLAGGELEPYIRTGSAVGMRATIIESWRRSLGTGLDPADLLAPVEADRSEARARWVEHPLGSLSHVLTEQLRTIAVDSQSLVVVSDASGLLLRIEGAEWLRERAREMNFVEGARYSEAAAGTNGIGTVVAAGHALQVFAFEHFNQRHHAWTCSGAPVHDPVSGRLLGVVDLSSPWKTVHPLSLALVTTMAKTMEQGLLDARRAEDARLRRRYGDLRTRSTDVLVNRNGYGLVGDHSTGLSEQILLPEGGGEVCLDDGSVAVAEPLGHGEAYLLRRLGPRASVTAPAPALERTEERARELAGEQAALRRVATLVARESTPQRLFTAVAEQVAGIVNVPLVRLLRYERDGSATQLGGWSEAEYDPFPVGSRWILDGPSVLATVRQTARPARLDDYAGAPGQVAAAVREAGMRSAVASPIVVEDRLWGAMVVLSPRREPLPEDTEARLADFTELVATAIANAESRAELAASRARVIAAADETRRQIERNIHDGAQQQLVTLALALRAAEAKVPSGLEDIRAEIGDVAERLKSVLEELREISRGIHPAILTEGGLEPALKALARRSTVPVELDVRCELRLPDGVEVAAYYIVSETVTNAAKHAGASLVQIELCDEEATLYLSIRDDGAGGADPGRGSGLIGLRDRVEALRGTIEIASPPGRGTQIHVEIPLPSRSGWRSPTSPDPFSAA